MKLTFTEAELIRNALVQLSHSLDVHANICERAGLADESEIAALRAEAEIAHELSVRMAFAADRITLVPPSPRFQVGDKVVFGRGSDTDMFGRIMRVWPKGRAPQTYTIQGNSGGVYVRYEHVLMLGSE